MAKTLDEFVEEVKTGIDDFEREYRGKAENEGEDYPLEFSGDNDGLWLEFFSEYLSGYGL